jgi:hypothetical protein
MDKGTKLSQMSQMLHDMAGSGIAVQVMAFTGFPSETFDEAMDTVQFLADRRELWTLGDIGEFVLTAGSLVARQPERYGVGEVRPGPDEDIPRSLHFTAPVRLDEEQQRTLTRAKRQFRVVDFDRPWLGGVDTPHSYFYHHRFGRGVVDVITGSLDRRAASWAGPWRLNGALLSPGPGLVLRRRAGVLSLEQRASGAEEHYLLRGDGSLYRLSPEVCKVLIGQVSGHGDAGADASFAAGVLRSAVHSHLIVPAATTRRGAPGGRERHDGHP